MNISVTKIDRRIQPLVWMGTACLVAGVAMLGLQVVDPRTIGESNVWLKPMKFAFSFWLYNWTLALILTPGGIEVTVEMYTKVDSRLAPSFLVKRVVQSSLAGIETFINENAPTRDRAGAR